MTPTPFVLTPWSLPSGLWVEVVALPATEPLTLEEAKMRAGMDWAPGDSREPLMREFISAARAKVEHDTGLALLEQTRRVYFAIPYVAGDLVMLPSQTLPAQSIVPIDVTGTPIAVVVQSPVRRRLDGRPLAVRLTSSWPANAAGFEVVAGWPTPEALKIEAPGLYHAVALLTAHYATLGRDLVTVGDLASKPEARFMPMGYEDAIGPHQLIWVT